MEKECAFCSELFSQKQKTQIYCSKKCNGKAQKQKEKIKNRERLNSIVRTCKNKTCEKKFNPNRNNQVFCSDICADREGKRDYKKRNPEKIRASENMRKKFKYHNDPKDREKKINASSSRYHKLSPEEKRERSRKNRIARDPDELKKYHREYFAERIKSDLNFLLISNLRTLTKGAIKRGGSKTDTKTLEYIGCSLEECREHIEDKFDEKMTWDNWDRKGWHLDHIRPCNSFNLAEENQRYVCFNWRNLRPLWWDKNINKRDKYDQTDEANWEKLMRDRGYVGDLFLLFK